MRPEENRFKVIGLLVDIESRTGELYGIFAEKFPEHSDTWAELAKEEQQHIGTIRLLGSSIVDESTVYRPKFRVEDLEASRKWLEETIKFVRNNAITIKDAIAIGLRIEKGMSEFPFHELFEPANESMKDFIEGVINAEKRHVKIIEQLSREER